MYMTHASELQVHTRKGPFVKRDAVKTFKADLVPRPSFHDKDFDVVDVTLAVYHYCSGDKQDRAPGVKCHAGMQPLTLLPSREVPATK
jgi:hypothetical protein